MTNTCKNCPFRFDLLADEFFCRKQIIQYKNYHITEIDKEVERLKWTNI